MTSPASTEQVRSVAPVAMREDWQLVAGQGLASEPTLAGADSEPLARALARAWTDQALQAHAAVAAYARFALDLLSLGAPAALLQGCAQALAEETAHAQACFSLARRYGGQNVGPGRLVQKEAAAERDLTSIVVGAVERGCVHETVRALAAREALEHCQDPATREILLRHQESKAQQAQLAWRFMAWALRGASRELFDRVRVAFLTALDATSDAAALSSRDRQLLRFGVLSEGKNRELEQRVLRDVVVPCMEAILARSGRASAPPPPF
jgi:hypothetical protein